MAVGDVKSDLQSVAASNYLDIRPPSGEEWVIHNIYHEYDVSLVFTDGTNELTFDSDTGAGVYAKYAFHVTNSLWIRVYNSDTANARLIGYDGVQTK
ncbi:hypothetical protein J7J18_03755 [bacterium]|nr:hypothetical protein [bacterium]